MSGISKIGATFTTYAVLPVKKIDTGMATDGDSQKSGERHAPENRQNAMVHMRTQKASLDLEAWARELHVRIQLARQLDRD